MKSAIVSLMRMVFGLCLFAAQLHAAVIFTAGPTDPATVELGSGVSVPVTVNGFANVSGFQFTLAWDSEVLALQDPPVVANASLSSGTSTYGTPASGRLTFVWETGGVLTLNPNTPILEAKFTAIGGVDTYTLLSFVDDPTQRQLTLTDPTEGTIEGTIANGLMSTVDGQRLTVVPEPAVNYAAGFCACFLIGLAGVRWISNRRRTAGSLL